MIELIRVLRFLERLSRSIPRSRLIVVLAIFAGVLSGFSNTGLLALINTALASGKSIQGRVVVWFIALCSFLPLCRLASRYLLIQLTNRGVSGLRLQLCRQVLATPLAQLEKLGPARLLAILTDDVGIITAAFAQVPLLSMHLAILVGSLAYLGWLSWKILLILLAFIGLGGLTYQLAVSRGLQFFARSRRERDTLFRHLRALTQGTKELQLHQARRRAFLSTVEETTEAVQRYSYKGELVGAAADSWGQILFFLVVGILVLVLPQMGNVSRQTLTGYTLVVLYLITPLEFLLNSLPFLGQAKVSIDSVERLETSLMEPVVEGRRETRSHALRDGLEISAITYTYHDSQRAEEFSVGPIDLAIQPGEIVFLTGGNGSGKTTLAKLLVGLYIPASGRILLDGGLVTDENRESYRQCFAAVFQDFFVFDHLLGLEQPDLDAKAREYLLRLQLDREVEVKDGRFSTVDLSQGQRKRLALLTAYLEDRPIYLFDEWAADQDPIFKEVFYREILSHLKQHNKMVIVISHDDRYYGLADRVIKLENGVIIADQRRSVLAAVDQR